MTKHILITLLFSANILATYDWSGVLKNETEETKKRVAYEEAKARLNALVVKSDGTPCGDIIAKLQVMLDQANRSNGSVIDIGEDSLPKLNWEIEEGEKMFAETLKSCSLFERMIQHRKTISALQEAIANTRDQRTVVEYEKEQAAKETAQKEATQKSE